jgi:hypothetical protein
MPNPYNPFDPPPHVTPVPDPPIEHNPYRGTETHGVEPRYDPVEIPGYDGRAVPVQHEIKEAPEIDPIPVKIVKGYTREIIMWRPSQTSIGQRSGMAERVVGRNEKRARLILKNAGPNNVFIGPSDGGLIIAGYRLDLNEVREFTAQDGMYAMCNPGEFATIHAIVEFADHT